MNIKEYLKYYIGCPAVNTWFPIEHKEFDSGWILKGVEYGNATGSYFLVNEKDETWTDSIKPVLRSMSSMSDDQLIHLATIYSGADRITRTKGIANNWFYFFCGFKKSNGGGVNETLVIDDKGEAWYEHYFDHKAKRGRGHNVINQAGAFHYLLSLGIDLFGLIDAGHAIDAATIKTGKS